MKDADSQRVLYLQNFILKCDERITHEKNLPIAIVNERFIPRHCRLFEGEFKFIDHLNRTDTL